MKNITAKLLIVLLGVFSFPLPLLAQNAAPLRGQVLDEVGAVIPGAKVTLVSLDGKRREVTTNAKGEFSIPSVPTGDYNLIVEFKGFQPHVQNGIKVSPSTEPLKVVMAVATVNETTEISADGKGLSVDPDQNLSGITLNEKMIQELLPDNEDDILEFLQSLAGGSGNAQVMIDGFTGGRLPPKESIMSIRINQSLFSAEFGSGGGGGPGMIEITTRPGNGTWRGNVGFNFHHSATDARNAFALTKPELDQQRYNFNFGGPLIKKRLDFNLNLDRSTLEGTGLVSATTLDGLYTTNVPSTTANKGLSLRAGLFINPKNTLTTNYNYRTGESVNTEFSPGGFGGGNFGGAIVVFIGGGGFGGGGGGNLMLPERASNNNNSSHSLSFAETFIINARMIHEARFRAQHDTNATTAKTQALAVNVIDAFQGGGSTCCPNNSRTNNFEFQDYLTLTLKKHSLKIGFQMQYEKYHTLSGSNFNGTYTFSTLDQYRRALNHERVDPGNPNSPFVTATQFQINRGNPLLRYDQWLSSWFIQDDIRLRNNLTVSLGLRHEFQGHLDDKLNFAPRIGIAWSPFKKTVIRTGGGLFFNRLSAGAYANTLRYDNVTQETITIFNPFYINPLPPDLFALNSNINVQPQRTTRSVLDPNLLAPYNLNGTFNVEQQLPKALVGTFGYSFNRGLHLFRTRNINAPLPGTGLRPDPTQGNINEYEAAGKSVRHELAFGLSRRFSTKLLFFSNYRLAWAHDDSAFPADNYNLKSEWARSSGDRRHQFNMNIMATLPWGIRVTPTLFVNSGAPFNIKTGLDDNFDTNFNDRPRDANGNIIGRNTDLPTSLYPFIPGPNRLVSSSGRPTLKLIDYLNTYFPNGIRAEGPGSVNINLGINKVFGFGRRGGNQQARNGNQPSAPNAQGAPGARGGAAPAGGPGGGGQQVMIGGGGGGGPVMIGGGGPMMMGGMGGPEASRFTVRLSASVTNIFNIVNFGQYGGTLGSPYLGLPSNAGAARQFTFNVQFGF